MAASDLHQIVHQDPTFGYDGWLNKDTKPAGLVTTAQALPAGADTIGADIGLLPVGLQMYASYVDNFGGYPQLVTRFLKSGAFLLSITIFGGKARCADVETGAMHATSLPHWLDNVALRDGGLLPWVYTNAGNMAACNAQIGSRKVVRWSAHFGHGQHICGPSTCGFPQADWTQWDDKGAQGQNIDRSIGFKVPTAPVPPTPPADPHHYAWFDAKPRLLFGLRYSERQTVEQYDRLRALANPPAARLGLLRTQAFLLAGRLKTIGHSDVLHRSWRISQLLARSEGKKVV